MRVAVLGAGAFGTALAIALAKKGPVTLWGRDAAQCADMARDRQNVRRLKDVSFPSELTVSSSLETVLTADILLLAMPMTALSGFVSDISMKGRTVVACCKGIDIETGKGPSHILREADIVAVLTGPSFARDIARGLPTALTLACADAAQGKALQAALSTPVLRLYRSEDVVGAELGGALKNVIAIGCGAVVGAGLGESARAALLTRGFSEMQRIAARFGAQHQTLMGLSGLGDLVLTCTSTQSRNYRLGLALGCGEAFDPAVTVEGKYTARALCKLAYSQDIDMPVCRAIADLVEGQLDTRTAMAQLMTRPLKEE